MIKNEDVIELLTIIEDMENPPTLIFTEKGNFSIEWKEGLDCKTEEGNKIKEWLIRISKNQPLGIPEELDD